MDNLNPTMNKDIRYSKKRIVGNSGKDYGMGVYLDSNLLTGLNGEERKAKVKSFVVTNLQGHSFVAYDSKGEPVDIRIAKKNEKYINEKGSKQKLIRELYNKHNDLEVKQEAVVLIDELISTAKYDTSLPNTHSHGWLDNYGNNNWDYWEVYIQEENGTVWKATLNITNTVDNEKILYDIDPIEKVEGVIKSTPATTKEMVTHGDVESQEQYSKRTLSNREILANALESTIDTSTQVGQNEAKYLADYKAKSAELDILQEHLQEVSAELKELSFAKGKRDMSKIRELRDEKIKTQNRISYYDKKLLSLESTRPIRELLAREKERMKRRYQEEGRERLRNYVSRRSETALRTRIKRISNEFEQRLLHGTDRKYVPKNLVNGIIDVCNAIDPTGRRQDTKVAEKYRTGREALANLKMQYDSLKTEDYDFSSEFNEEFSSLISQLADYIGDTPLRDLSRDQLEYVHDLISDISYMLKDATKQIGTSESITNYEAGQELIANMQRVKALGLTTNKVDSFFREWTENPMRAVREMSGFDENSRLVKLFNGLNEGRREGIQ